MINIRGITSLASSFVCVILLQMATFSSVNTSSYLKLTCFIWNPFKKKIRLQQTLHCKRVASFQVCCNLQKHHNYIAALWKGTSWMWKTSQKWLCCAHPSELAQGENGQWSCNCEAEVIHSVHLPISCS